MNRIGIAEGRGVVCMGIFVLERNIQFLISSEYNKSTIAKNHSIGKIFCQNGCQYGTSVNDCSSKFSFCLFRNLILFFLGQYRWDSFLWTLVYHRNSKSIIRIHRRVIQIICKRRRLFEISWIAFSHVSWYGKNAKKFKAEFWKKDKRRQPGYSSSV